MGVPFGPVEARPYHDVWEGDEKVPMPQGVATLEEWGQGGVQKMEGHRDISIHLKNFGQILGVLAYRVSKVRKYLQFIVKKFRSDMDVSENSGTTKSSILIGFSIINHPFWGTPIFGNTHIIYTNRCHFNPEDEAKSTYVP